MDGLKRHEKPLRVLLRLAPTGFPAFAKVKAALILMQERHKVFGPCENPERMAVASADRWRIMTKDVYGLARRGYDEALLADLVSMIQMEEDEDEDEAFDDSHCGDACATLDGIDDKLSELGDGVPSDVIEPDDAESDLVCVGHLCRLS